MNKDIKKMVDALLNNDKDTAKQHLSQYVNMAAAKIVNNMPTSTQTQPVNEAYDNDTAELQQVPIEKVKKGTYVRKTATSKKTYQAAGYEDGKYRLDDEDDISRSIYVKKGTMVYVGFEY